MDLVARIGRVVVVMNHTNRQGASKVLKQCALSMSGKGVVYVIITNLGMLDVTDGGLRIEELAPGVRSEDMLVATLATIA